MAILDSSFKTGNSWVSESMALFKAAPRKWLLLSMAYVAIFMMLPSIFGSQFFAVITILIWPAFLSAAIAMYRNADMKKQQNLAEIAAKLQPKLLPLITLGASCLLYSVLMSFVFKADIQALLNLVPKEGVMTESQTKIVMQTMLPVLLKLSLALVPVLMATWFAPMLIAFNNYTFLKAIKSSIAGCLQYMTALGVSWLLLTLGIAVLMLVAGIVAGLISVLVPVLGQILMPMVLFSLLLLATALMLAFQYVSYRDVFRAA